MTKQEMISEYGAYVGYYCDEADKWGARIYDSCGSMTLFFSVPEFKCFRTFDRCGIDSADMVRLSFEGIMRCRKYKLVYEGKSATGSIVDKDVRFIREKESLVFSRKQVSEIERCMDMFGPFSIILYRGMFIVQHRSRTKLLV